MLLKRRLRAIIGQSNTSNDLIMRAALATFPNMRALDAFFTEAGISPDDEREALNAVLTVSSGTLSVNPWFRRSLASFFKLTGAHTIEDHVSMRALIPAYRSYMGLKERAADVFSQFSPGEITPDELGKVAEAASRVSTAYMHGLGMVKMHEEDTLYHFMKEQAFPLAFAYEDNVSAEMFLALYSFGLTAPAMKLVSDACVPPEQARAYIAAGCSPEQAIEFWREGVPSEYASAL